MNKVYIISANYVKSNSEVYDNVEDKFLSRSILSAQDIDIQDLLGTELYQLVVSECYNKAINSGYTMQTRIQTLVDDYLIPALLYSVLRDIIPFIYFKITPSSVSSNDNDVNQNKTDYKIIALFRKEYETKYQHYSMRMTNYLDLNYATFPEWNCLNTSGDVQNMVPNKDRSYYGGIQLG